MTIRGDTQKGGERGGGCCDQESSAHLEEIRLALAVDACEGCVNGALNAPDITDELGVAGPHAGLVQLIEVFPWEERRRGGWELSDQHQVARETLSCQKKGCGYLGKHKGSHSSGR